MPGVVVFRTTLCGHAAIDFCLICQYIRPLRQCRASAILSAFRAIADWIAHRHDERLHQALDYLAPREYRARLAERAVQEPGEHHRSSPSARAASGRSRRLSTSHRPSRTFRRTTSACVSCARAYPVGRLSVVAGSGHEPRSADTTATTNQSAASISSQRACASCTRSGADRCRVGSRTGAAHRFADLSLAIFSRWRARASSCRAPRRSRAARIGGADCKAYARLVVWMLVCPSNAPATTRSRRGARATMLPCDGGRGCAHP